MSTSVFVPKSLITCVLMSTVLCPIPAVAGPPLLCHEIEIGESASLPWGDGVWSNDQIKLSETEFVSQTLDFLSPAVPVLTRMETMRRAAIQASETRGTAALILKVLRERARDQGTDGQPSPHALFDYGYMIAVCVQMNEVTDYNARGLSGKTRKALEIPEGTDPYALVKRASELSDHDPQMEFALALMTLYPAGAAHQMHLQRAVRGAADGSLLAINLVRRFGRDGQNLADLRATIGMVEDGDRR